MKKKYIKIFPIIITSLVIIVVISILVITIIRKKDVFYFITQPKHYYLPNSNLTLDIEVYSNHQKDYYLNKDTIEKLHIKDNIKNDLAIEGMEITDIDVNLYRQFANEEIDMPQLINTIKNEIEIGGTYEG